MSTLQEEISRRRTFAIISHPDAGKTTLTEKFLLYGGAIAQAGAVKGKKNARAAVSDWMEIEKQRGISVTSSVMQFQYEGFCINILDTPGHQDFSEDTYRTLMAADSAVMVIDGSKGVEAQTRKLFKVCAMRHIPIFTFVNKMDREAKDPFDLLDELENELGIETYAVNWPIGCGKEFQGVYNRRGQHIDFFSGVSGKRRADREEVLLDDPRVGELIGADRWQQLRDDVELLGAGREFDMDEVRRGRLSPVFFGSALTNFGVEPFLEAFLQMTPPPLSRTADCGVIDAFSPDFSAFVFKIQANMNKAHRDRLAFLRICSGKYEREAEVLPCAGRPASCACRSRSSSWRRSARSSTRPTPGISSACSIPASSPSATPSPRRAKSSALRASRRSRRSISARVSPKDTMKRKQFVKGTEQIAQEGAIQIFKVPDTGMEEVIVGVVGTLQFDVFRYRMQSEYGVELRMEGLPYEVLRYIRKSPVEEKELNLSSDVELLEDYRGHKLLVFSSPWAIDFTLRRNPGLELVETLQELDTAE